MPLKEREKDIQKSFFSYLDIRHPDVREVSFAIPNGGSRKPWEGKSLREQGLTAGIPDICIAQPVGIYHGLYIEVKSATGKLSIEQINKLAALNSRGYFATVCYGYDSMIDTLEEYLASSIPKHKCA